MVYQYHAWSFAVQLLLVFNFLIPIQGRKVRTQNPGI
jgi:hypothetical protein